MNQKNSETQTILLVEDNPGDARLIEEMIGEINLIDGGAIPAFHLLWRKNLKDGLEALKEGAVQLVLLDLSLPDSQGFETFRKTQEGANRTPVILLTGLNDERLAIDVVRSGAQDFLQKAGLSAFYLVRAIRYAIERKSFEEEIKQLSQKIIQAREEERSAFSQEVHDGLGQALLALKLQLQSRISKLENRSGIPLTEEVADIVRYLDEILQEVRTISHNLSPIGLKGLGIAQAIQELVKRFSHEGGLRITADVAAMDNFFPENWDINVYRIIEQALVNAIRHANAKQIEIKAAVSGETLTVSVEDDGIGMDITAPRPSGGRKGLGLHIMQERARIVGGSLQIIASPGKGARIQVEIPLRP